MLVNIIVAFIVWFIVIIDSSIWIREKLEVNMNNKIAVIGYLLFNAIVGVIAGIIVMYNTNEYLGI